MEGRLFVWQRLSAMVLAPLVLIHLGLILYAARGGLSAGDILARTRGSLFWTLFYGLFVIAASIHAPLGLRHVLLEWSPLRHPMIDRLTIVFALLLLGLGLRGVGAVTGVLS